MTMPNDPAVTQPTLRARRLHLQSQHQAVVVMRTDCHVCRSEGLAARSQVLLSNGERHVQATLFQVEGDSLLALDEDAVPGDEEALRLRDQVEAMVAQTALGAATLAAKSDLSFAELRAEVTSKGGTTEAALHALSEGKLAELIDRAVKAADARSKSLASS